MKLKKTKYRKKREVWVREIFQYRKQRGEFHRLIADLRLHGSDYFFKYFRMSPTKYELLLRMVAPKIIKDIVNVQIVLDLVID